MQKMCDMVMVGSNFDAVNAGYRKIVCKFNRKLQDSEFREKKIY